MIGNDLWWNPANHSAETESIRRNSKRTRRERRQLELGGILTPRSPSPHFTSVINTPRSYEGASWAHAEPLEHRAYRILRSCDQTTQHMTTAAGWTDHSLHVHGGDRARNLNSIGAGGHLSIVLGIGDNNLDKNTKNISRVHTWTLAYYQTGTETG